MGWHQTHLAQLRYAPVRALCLVGAATFPFWAGKPGMAWFILPGVLLGRRKLGRLKGRLRKRGAEVKRAVRGAQGEEDVADLLAQLGDRYAVFHDLPSPYGNIDHLVLSRTQGLFLLETKAHGGRVGSITPGSSEHRSFAPALRIGGGQSRVRCVGLGRSGFGLPRGSTRGPWRRHPFVKGAKKGLPTVSEPKKPRFSLEKKNLMANPPGGSPDAPTGANKSKTH